MNSNNEANINDSYDKITVDEETQSHTESLKIEKYS